MKTAEQWQEELAGETSVESIRQIQIDALAWAATLPKHPATSLLQKREQIWNKIEELQK